MKKEIDLAGVCFTHNSIARTTLKWVAGFRNLIDITSFVYLTVTVSAMTV